MHVGVQPEQIPRIVLVFQLNQPCVITFIVLVDRFGRFVRDLIGVKTSGVRFHPGPCLFDVADMRATVIVPGPRRGGKHAGLGEAVGKGRGVCCNSVDLTTAALEKDHVGAVDRRFARGPRADHTSVCTVG